MKAPQAPANPLDDLDPYLETGEEAIRWLSENTDFWIAVAFGLGLFLLLVTLRRLITAFLGRMARGREDSWALVARSVLAKSGTLFFLAISVTSAARLTDLPDPVRNIIAQFTVVVVVFQLAIWVTQLLSAILTRQAAKNAKDDSALSNAMSLIQLFVRFLVWSLAFLLVLDNLGVDVTTLVAGLGIGGIAIGLAAQGIMSDLFASLSIVLDKPFVLKDFIIFGDMMGTVERIGLKTTRIRSLSGEQIVVSNADLLSTRIRNFKRMNERRVVFEIGVLYGTPMKSLQKAPALIREAIEAQSEVRFDRCHFARYGDSSLNFECVYYVLSADYTLFMDKQQAINFAIYERFEAEGLDFAFPTRTVHLVQDDPPAAPVTA